MKEREVTSFDDVFAMVESICDGCVFMCNAEWIEYILEHCPTKPECDDVLCCILECAKGNFDYKAKTIHAPYIEQIKQEFKMINCSYGK